MKAFSYKFILNSEEIPIPIDSTFLNFIDPEVYYILLSQKQYKVKSEISFQLFQSFVQNCIKNEPLNINIDNISQYERICKEFNYKIDSIQLFQNSYIYTLETQNKHLRQRISEESIKLKRKKENYQKILHFVFKDENIYINSKYPSVKKRLFACKEQNINFIKLLTSKIIEKNGLLYIIDEKKFDASVFCELSSELDVFIPKTIIYQSKEFVVKRLFENSFESSELKSICFPEDSQLNSIGKNAFSQSCLERIVIPSSVTSIETGAFQMCYQLKKVEFSKNSQLTLIDRSTFYSSSIEEILIPSKVTTICEYAFGDCGALKAIEFEKKF